jgi:hyperosmotically inducible protein
MKTTQTRLWTLRTAGALSAVALVMGLVGCNRQDDGRSVGQKLDSAVNKTEQSASNMKNEAKEKMASAESSMKNSGAEMKDATKDATAAVTSTIDDVTITASVSAGLAKDPDLSAIKINVDTSKGVVTLSGPAPSDTAKDRATTIAQNVKGVSSVNNQLMVKAG